MSVKVTSLPELQLFSELSEEEFSLISKDLELAFFREGDTIFKEGDAGEDMYILFSGALNASITQLDGTQRRLFNIELGEFFGEMSIIAHDPRSATITATADSNVIIFKAVDFYKIISQYPIIGFKILRTISIVQNQWLNQSSKSYSDLIRWGETARRRAITDEMTGLYNRRFLEESIKERFSNKSMNLRVMSLLMMDLDRIHNINDKYGTKAGDLVIISAAEVIRSCLRPGDIPARLAGDEFAILLPDTDMTNAQKVAERIRENIENKQVEVPENPGASNTVFIGTRTSIGIALAPAHAVTVEDFVHVSDSALRRAKDLGRNRVEIYG
jgi:diguanylate cyclase (GGDEF)-like protein